jgi:3-oxoacyl-[acyl-carrier-protein] synthase II
MATPHLDSTNPNHRAILVTGIGAVTAYGVGFDRAWDALCAGRHALARIARLNPDGFACKVGAEVKDFSAKDHVPKSYRKAVKVMARDTELAVAAAKLAVEDARLITRGTDDPAAASTYSSDRLGCHIGAGLIAAETDELTSALATATAPPAAPPAAPASANFRPTFDLRRWGTIDPADGTPTGGMGNLQPLWMLKYLPNMLACHVTIIHGAEGPSNTITCAEASGLLSIGESSRIIERGDADACFSGGAESKLSLMGLLRMTLAGRLTPIDDVTPDRFPVCPFAAHAAGTVPGEAGGIVLLEDAASARARAARPYARVAGFGAAQSPAPCIPPLPRDDRGTTNTGLALAIRAALRDAHRATGITPNDIDLIVPQACGVAALDAGEARALVEALGPTAASNALLLPLTPFLGDCSAGNGGLQVAFAARALRDQFVPGLPETLVRSALPTTLGLNLAPRASAPARLRAALVCSSSQGGQNAAVVLAAAN